MDFREIAYYIGKGEIEGVKDEVLRFSQDEGFIRCMRFHNLGPIIYAHFPELREVFALDMAVSKARWKVWKEAKGVFEISPVPVVALKGVDVGRYYPVPEMRFISDVDVWVSKRNIGELSDHLVKHGFRHVADVPNQRIFQFEGLRFEIHTSLTRFPYPPFISEDGIEEHSKRHRGNLHYPDVDLALSVMYVHAYKSMYIKTSFKAIWWYDEMLLKEAGGKTLGIPKVKRAQVWFMGVGPADLLCEETNYDLRIRVKYLIHALKMWV